MTYLDESGKKQFPLMGCYGIGVGQLMASVIEDCHDDRGPVWPWSIAPFQIHICLLDGTDPVLFKRADDLYKEFMAQGFDVLWDDTNNQAGAQFADADLIGAPIRLVVSPRNEKLGVIEYLLRDGSAKARISPAEVVKFCVDQRRRFA